MGNQASAIATNEIIASANTSVASQESCNNNQVINADPIKVTIGQVDCGTFKLGNVTATSKATCNQYQDIAITSKVMADQIAEAAAKTGIAIFDNALANADNFIEVQNNIAAMLAASCTNSQKVNIAERSFTAGVLRGQDCDIFNGQFSQEAACIQTLKADIQNITELRQTSRATATAGVDLGQLILFLLLIFGGLALLSVFGAIIKAVIMGGSKAATQTSGLFGSGGPSIGELSAKAKALRKILQQRDLAASNVASFVSSIQRPPLK